MATSDSQTCKNCFHCQKALAKQAKREQERQRYLAPYQGWKLIINDKPYDIEYTGAMESLPPQRCFRIINPVPLSIKIDTSSIKTQYEWNIKDGEPAIFTTSFADVHCKLLNASGHTLQDYGNKLYARSLGGSCMMGNSCQRMSNKEFKVGYEINFEYSDESGLTPVGCVYVDRNYR